MDNQQKIITDHYNARPNTNLQERKQTTTYYMKNFNNWIKSILIQEYCKPGFSVFDIAGGKGGDLPKWKQAKIGHLTLTDIAQNSVEEALERYETRMRHVKTGGFAAKFITYDSCQPNIQFLLPQQLYFDLVSCQFAFHYSFESEEKARNFLSNVSSRLVVGGHFIATIPNANRIVKRIRETISENPNIDREQTLSFGNDIYHIQFEVKDYDSNSDFQKGINNTFGCQYTFTLLDSVEDCPEYLVNLHVLKRLSLEYGLEMIETQPFHQYYQDKIKDTENQKLLIGMNCVDGDSTIQPNLWEAISVYSIISFQKVKNIGDEPQFAYRPPNQQKLPNLSKNDIITIQNFNNTQNQL